jgi:alkaline phosphatase
MMKRVRETALVAAMALAVAGVARAEEATLSGAQTANPWFESGAAELRDRLARTPVTGRARNVILMIADGASIGTIYATRLYAGQQVGGFGDEHVLPFERFPNLALAKTYTVNAQTPDSAGTATAMMTGVKTRSGVIGVGPETRRGNCLTNVPLKSIGDLFAEDGRSVGYVTTARITHATPAAGYAKSAERSYEVDAGMPRGCEEQGDIALQLFERMRAGEVDLALGGGRRSFFPRADEIRDEEGRLGRRGDGRHLIEEAKAAGFQYAWNAESFSVLDLARRAPILGLFESSHMAYEHDRTDEPSLADMTAAAIRALSENKEGFFLQVEAGRIDHANHAGNLHRAVTDGLAFAEATRVAAEMTDPSDTLIIVTADHGHSVGFNGYCGRGSPIPGLCYGIDSQGTGHAPSPVLAADGKPYTVAGYLNGDGSVLREENAFLGDRPALSNDAATAPDYRQQALIPLGAETHSGEDVAIYARGPWAHLLDGTVEQSFIFHVMAHAAGLGPTAP